jgi:chromate transporter
VTSPDATTVDANGLNAPQSRTDLFWSFTWLALQGFGGVLAVVQRELVEKKRWMTREQFIEDWAVAQIMPGPNVVNLSMMIGDRYFGLSGALVALAGMLVLPTLVVLALAIGFASVADHEVAQRALRGMGAVAAGLVIATGIKLSGALRSSLMGLPACTALAVAAFVAIAWLRWPLLWVLLIIGGTGCLWAWHCLGRSALKSRSTSHAPDAPALAPAAAPPEEDAASLTDADSGQGPRP